MDDVRAETARGAGSRPLDIRPMQTHEREVVERLVDPQVLERRIELARAGDISFWIAWLGDVPVGHVKVQWNTSINPEKYGDLPPGMPALEWLGVVEEYRGRGIGTRLMETAEAAARERGHDGIALGVGLENHGARRLYARRGYRELGAPPRYLSWTFIGPDGAEQTEGEWVTWQVRELRTA